MLKLEVTFHWSNLVEFCHGVIELYDWEEGYGLITPHNGGKSIFFHDMALEGYHPFIGDEVYYTKPRFVKRQRVTQLVLFHRITGTPGIGTINEFQLNNYGYIKPIDPGPFIPFSYHDVGVIEPEKRYYFLKPGDRVAYHVLPGTVQNFAVRVTPITRIGYGKLNIFDFNESEGQAGLWLPGKRYITVYFSGSHVVGGPTALYNSDGSTKVGAVLRVYWYGDARIENPRNDHFNATRVEVVNESLGHYLNGRANTF